MKLIILSGGLGNQMFQYAFFLMMRRHFRHVYLSLRKIKKTPEHNGFELDRVFPRTRKHTESVITKLTAIPYLSPVISHLLCVHKFREREYYKAIPLSLLHKKKSFGTRYVGYWQSEKYFSKVQDEVRQAFHFDEQKLNARSFAFAEELRKKSNTVSVHVRRGDYLNNPNFSNICTEEYYRRAFNYIHEKVNAPFYVLFTDDTEYFRSHFSDLKPCILVDWNRGKDSWQDIFLISLCSHHIIANSSFSWWGAWLDSKPDKIVCAPSPWILQTETPDIIPPQWKTIQMHPAQ